MNFVEHDGKTYATYTSRILGVVLVRVEDREIVVPSQCAAQVRCAMGWDARHCCRIMDALELDLGLVVPPSPEASWSWKIDLGGVEHDSSKFE